MAEKEQVTKEKVEYSGLWDFKSFYMFAHSWLEEEGYDVEEEKYSETVSGNLRNINFEWKAKKSPSDDFEHELKLKFEVKDLSDVEVEIDGKKKKMNKGKVSVELKGTLIKDPSSKWDVNMAYRFLRDTYNKYIVPKRVSSHVDNIVSDVVGLKEELKSFLELSGRRK